MCQHYFSVFVLDVGAFFVSAALSFSGLFDVTAWKDSIRYMCLPLGVPQFAGVYVAFDVALPVLMHLA